MAREISQGAYKLARISMLIKKNYKKTNNNVFEFMFFKKLNFFCLELILYIFRLFYYADIKNNFLKIKKNYFNIFLNKN
jgi:hypothetical protein